MTRPTKLAPATEVPPTSRAPFGALNRQRLISEFLQGYAAQGASALWESVYRLLLWVDKTNGLAHCYESDKCQPGKPWYPRSLRFHDWLAGALKYQPSDVGTHLDWLFRRTANQYAGEILRKQQTVLRRAESQREGYAARGFPEPGEDPAIIEIIRQTLGSRLLDEPSAHEWVVLTQRIREVIAVENKRKNLVGEGFEDVLAALLSGAGNASEFEVSARKALHQIPGFANMRTGEKVNKVDLAIVDKIRNRQTLVTAKWSIRADREKQFPAEFASYVQARSNLDGFSYTLVTNEFDPARLARACEAMAGNGRMLTHVVHINPQAIRAVYGLNAEASMRRVLDHIDARRLIGLDDWLAELGITSPTGSGESPNRSRVR